uniref:Uncharacterized protein n=1 Tax=viral metagenome TaxID=1070528 RepID=A0A6C0ED68_9ZZZZ
MSYITNKTDFLIANFPINKNIVFSLISLINFNNLSDHSVHNN